MYKLAFRFRGVKRNLCPKLLKNCTSFARASLLAEIMSTVSCLMSPGNVQSKIYIMHALPSSALQLKSDFTWLAGCPSQQINRTN